MHERPTSWPAPRGVTRTTSSGSSVDGVAAESSISNVLSRSVFAKDGDDAHCTTHSVAYHADLDGGLALDVVAAVARAEAVSVSLPRRARQEGTALRAALHRPVASPSQSDQ